MHASVVGRAAQCWISSHRATSPAYGQLSEAVLIQPPRDLLPHAVVLGREIFRLARAHHKPAHSRDLYAISAQLCALTAWLAGHVGLLDTADLYGRTASACAVLADEPHTSAWALVVRSKTAFWRGEHHLVADFARQGLEMSPSGTSTLMLACQMADAYSQLGHGIAPSKPWRR